MNSLIYWLLFSILVSLLIILAGYLILNIIWDIFIKPRRDVAFFSKEEMIRRHNDTLTRYEFDKKDVEDLTRIEKNFKTDIPRVTFSNEVKCNEFLEDLKQRRNSLLEEKKDETEYDYTTDAMSENLASINEDEEKENDETDGAKEVISLNDSKSVETFRAIQDIEKQAKRTEDEMNRFSGGANDLRYYEINEKYIRLMIALCDLNCETDEIRKKKNQVMVYVEQCQNILKSKSH